MRSEISSIVTSTETKAVQTGQHVAKQLDLPLHQNPDLGEHRRANEPFFHDPSRFSSTIRRLFEYPDQVIFGTETANEALSRFSRALSGYLGGPPCLFITHGTVLSLYVASISDRSGFEVWSSLGNALSDHDLVRGVPARRENRGLKGTECPSNPSRT